MLLALSHLQDLKALTQLCAFPYLIHKLNKASIGIACLQPLHQLSLVLYTTLFLKCNLRCRNQEVWDHWGFLTYILHMARYK